MQAREGWVMKRQQTTRQTSAVSLGEVWAVCVSGARLDSGHAAIDDQAEQFELFEQVLWRERSIYKDMLKLKIKHTTENC